MVQHVQTKRFCDPHLVDNDEEVEATWSEMVSIGKVTRLLELCSEHKAKIIGDLDSQLTLYGSSRPTEVIDLQRRFRKLRATSAEADKEPEVPAVEAPSGPPAPTNATEGRMCDQCPAGPFKNLGVHKRHSHPTREQKAAKRAAKKAKVSA